MAIKTPPQPRQHYERLPLVIIVGISLVTSLSMILICNALGIVFNI